VKIARRTESKRPSVSRKITPSQARDLGEIMGLINRARFALAGEKPHYVKDETFAAACGHGVSTLYAWQRKETSPKFFDLRDFLRAVGLDVQIVSQADKRPVALHVVTGEDVTDDTKQMVAIMESLSEKAQANLVKMAMAYARVWGGDESPPEPAAGNGPERDRRGGEGPDSQKDPKGK
jgi:hypothetical protein